MSEIKSYMQEYIEVNKEIAELNKQRKVLLERKRDVSIKINEYLMANDMPGIRDKDTVFYLQETSVRQRLNKKEKLEKGMRFLEAQGVRDPKSVLEKLAEEMKGVENKSSKLKIKEFRFDF
jgi:hypothetical protein